MAMGALHNSGADSAVAVSGIAGPGGATQDKPLGSVYVAFGSRDDMRVRHFVLPMRRTMFQRMVASIALDLVRRYVQGITTEVEYYAELRAKPIAN